MIRFGNGRPERTEHIHDAQVVGRKNGSNVSVGPESLDHVDRAGIVLERKADISRNGVHESPAGTVRAGEVVEKQAPRPVDRVGPCIELPGRYLCGASRFDDEHAGVRESRSLRRHEHDTLVRTHTESDSGTHVGEPV
jgi:hypothetical protein